MTTQSATALEVAPEAGLTATVAGAVATITLDRPERLNSQTPHTWTALSRLRARLGDDVRVIVLRGSGRSFSAGLDRAMFTLEGLAGLPGILDLARQDFAGASARIADWQEAFDWTSRPGQVSIAAVQGHAIGAGCQLALGADIRIIADDAQFSLPEPMLGLVPDLGGTKRLVDLVGYSRASEICLTARRVGAEEALRIGLASVLVPSSELDDAVERTVAALLAVDRDAQAATKGLLLAASGHTQDEQQAAERAAQYQRLRALAARETP